jgi:NADH-quinone oxidoreductase chain G
MSDGVTTITMTIDGRELEVPEGTRVLRAARAAGISIPSLCDYELVEPFGACRMCLVEVEGMPRLQTACTLLPANGMTVITESEVLTKARRDVLELLLINHPLDCPFCDKSGECDLQHMVLKYGPTTGRYTEEKRLVPADHSDHLLARTMERCIACERCVRICDEVQGASALTMVGRGGDTRMEPFSPDAFDCEYCGNCLPACPVGAILSTLEMHNYRPWQIDREVETVCGHCGVGCRLVVQVRDESIARIASHPGLGFNRGLLCALGRFGHEYVGSEDRLSTPLIRREGDLEECSWEEAISFVAERLLRIREIHGGVAIAGVASPRCTNEDNYVFQKFLRVGCASNNIDSLSRLGFAAAQHYLESMLGSGITANQISSINGCDAILVVGGDPTAINPILGTTIRQAARHGARVGVLGHAPGLERFTAAEVVPEYVEEPAVLEALLVEVAAASELTDGAIDRKISAYVEEMRPSCPPPDGFVDLVDLLVTAAAPAIVLGPELVQRSDGYRALASVAGLTRVLGARLFLLAEGPNEQGLVDVGCVPDRLPGGVPVGDTSAGKKLAEMWRGSVPETPGLSLMELVEAAGRDVRALYVMGENPAFKLPNGSHVHGALSALELLVVQDIFLTETGLLADVVLPALAWSERDGTFTNIERRVQRTKRAVAPRFGRADWKIVCDLAAAMGHPMDYAGPDQILEELIQASPLYECLSHGSLNGDGWLVRRDLQPQELEFPTGPWIQAVRREGRNGVSLGIERSLFHSGTTSRHAPALRPICPEATAKLSSSLANELALRDGELVRLSTPQGSVTVPVQIDLSIRDRRVLLCNHYEGKGVLGLLDYTVDPVTKAPGLEACGVRIEKVEVEEA